MRGRFYSGFLLASLFFFPAVAIGQNDPGSVSGGMECTVEGNRVTLSWSIQFFAPIDGWTLFRDGSLRQVGAVYLRRFFRRSPKFRRNVIGFAQFVNRCVTHWHFYKFTREARTGRLRLFNSG